VWVKLRINVPSRPSASDEKPPLGQVRRAGSTPLPFLAQCVTMDRFLLDIRHSLRALRRSRGLALGASVALALGIGATTTLFSIVRGGTSNLPFEEPDELVVLTTTSARQGRTDLPVRPFDLAAWSEQQASFEALAGFEQSAVNIADPGLRPERRSGVFIAPAAFALIGVSPERGRGLTEDDAQPAAPPVALIAHELWQARYAAAPDIIGRVIRVDGEARTIVGVMPPRFGFPVNQQVWLPLPITAAATPAEGPSYTVFGRLRDGVSLKEARVEMDAIAARLAQAYPATHAERGIHVMPFVDMEMDPENVPVLYLMMLAVSFVLVIACANVANLLLARAATRTKEVAIRMALGASRRRLVMQHLLESLTLAAIGGVAGVLLAYAGVRFFDLATANIIEAFWIDFRVDRTVLVFATSLVTIAGVSAGILPALRASGAPSAALLKDVTGAGSLRIGRLSRSLVVIELALMCGLLAVSGTFVKAALGLRAIDMPVPAREILTAQLSLVVTRDDSIAHYNRMLRDITERIRTTPGVRAGTLISILPGRGAGNWTFTLDGAIDSTSMRTTGVVFVTPGFLDVLNAQVRNGRDLSWNDDERSAAVALVNESWVQRYSSDRDPIGRTIALEAAHPITIVGIVPDLQMQNPGDERADGVYMPLLQHAPYGVRVMARADAAPLALAAPIRDRIEALTPDLPLFEIATLHDAIYADASVLDAFGVLFAIFGAGALFLAVIGLYGVVSFGVTQRTREFGVRIAVGATRADILGLVLRQGGKALLLGGTIGMLLAIGLHRGLAAAIDIVQPGDVLLFAAVLGALTLTALVALLVPARRAARTEPLVALRHD
jgi:putative ABC transport system permease protein